MPRVKVKRGGKTRTVHYPYTPEGRAAAHEAAVKERKRKRGKKGGS